MKKNMTLQLYLIFELLIFNTIKEHWCAKIKDAADKINTEQGNKTDCFDPLSHIFTSGECYGNDVISVKMEIFCTTMH